MREAYEDDNVKANEYLYRRVDLEDAVSAHLIALERARSIRFGLFVVSATTPFRREDLAELGTDAPGVVARIYPEHVAVYSRRGWRMFPEIDRVYVNAKARAELGWTPRFDFRHVLDRLTRDADPRSDLARRIGTKGYHAAKFVGRPYPTRQES